MGVAGGWVIEVGVGWIGLWLSLVDGFWIEVGGRESGMWLRTGL